VAAQAGADKVNAVRHGLPARSVPFQVMRPSAAGTARQTRVPEEEKMERRGFEDQGIEDSSAE